MSVEYDPKPYRCKPKRFLLQTLFLCGLIALFGLFGLDFEFFDFLVQKIGLGSGLQARRNQIRGGSASGHDSEDGVEDPAAVLDDSRGVIEDDGPSSESVWTKVADRFKTWAEDEVEELSLDTNDVDRHSDLEEEANARDEDRGEIESEVGEEDEEDVNTEENKDEGGDEDTQNQPEGENGEDGEKKEDYKTEKAIDEKGGENEEENQGEGDQTEELTQENGDGAGMSVEGEGGGGVESESDGEGVDKSDNEKVRDEAQEDGDEEAETEGKEEESNLLERESKATDMQ
eukprot:CAMPEP_0183717892 /NCGR_PEP_ID=MMETSP0737-20130205/11330_1 /TAXON_ID=385413 /ORGANISM="Thalassiosira miniscula, Strain CCMP1093" /LENGTH=287 /DNA_ID=CAMNT_0025947369 /DNA_START=457 /DNA_END=1320 /DNA_ORIENTATION=-